MSSSNQQKKLRRVKLVFVLSGAISIFILFELTLLLLNPSQLLLAQPPTDAPFELVDVGMPEADTSTSVAWGDYDGDGDLDLAVGNGSLSLSPPDIIPVGKPNRVYRNEGGEFVLAWSSPEHDPTTSVAWGDYDGDGDLDLAVGNYSEVNRVYRYDQGQDIFVMAWSSTEKDLTFGLSWGDYNKDNYLDLAIANGGITYTQEIVPKLMHVGQPNRIYSYDQIAQTFNQTWFSAESDTTTSIAWGDYNNDTYPDLAVGNWGVNRLYHNNEGSISSSGVWTSTDASLTADIAWGDVDNDSFLDLAAGNGGLIEGAVFQQIGQPNHLYSNIGGILTNTASWTSTEIELTSAVAWGDYDNDGFLDLGTGNANSDNPTAGTPDHLHRNDNGNLIETAVWESQNTLSSDIAWGDYDNDGALDLIIATSNIPSGAASLVYRNTTAGLTSTLASTSTGLVESMAWGDYDGDGDLDLAVGGRNQPNRLYENIAGALTGSPVWTSTESYTTTSLAWGDVDGDHDLDLAVGYRDQPNLLYENVDGALTVSSIWASTESDSTESVAWGDIDGDGDLDLAVGNFGQPNRIYHNTGGNLTASGVWTSTESDGTTSVAWGDIDGDGDLDLAVGNLESSALEGYPNHLYENVGGTLTSSSVWTSTESERTEDLAWGDVDDDGDLDLAVGNYQGLNRIYYNQNGLSLNGQAWSADSDFTWSVAWGDYDGDGDLDLAVGNGGVLVGSTLLGQENKVYRNDAGVLASPAAWLSEEELFTIAVAWGDVDGDGDLDLAAGDHTPPDISSPAVHHIYYNQRRPVSPLSATNTPPRITVSRPGDTDDAFFFSTPQILRGDYITIPYTLFDEEGDSVPKIFPEFSPNGGGNWLPATPGLGGDGSTNLAASPEGISHTFVWHAEADLIKNDNVVFRIRAQPAYRHSPILWPAVAAQSPPFRVEAAWYIKVEDEVGQAVPGAVVFADGLMLTQLNELTTTDQAGFFNPGVLANGTSLVALSLKDEQPTVRNGHAGWAYRTYLTSEPHSIQTSAPQTLVVKKDKPLILFNLLVSIEWNADQTYTGQISQALRLASNYLYDISDGQMAFGQVAIYDNAAFWADADIQIFTKNHVHPHAYVGGIVSGDKSDVMRIGRFWDGNSGNRGDWNEPAGFRTLVHEFGHYALHLYDEYFVYIFDQQGQLLTRISANCTQEILDSSTDATNASIMYNQYAASELSARDVPGLWSSNCESTAQWQLNPTTAPNDTGESAWETLARIYGDTTQPSRWTLATPMNRGAVLAGPDDLRPDFPSWPTINIHQVGLPVPPRQLTVFGPSGIFGGALVALYKQDGRVIGQGFTDENGELTIYGALEGDDIRAISFNGGLGGMVTVSDAPSFNLTMTPVGNRAAGQNTNVPHMKVRADPIPASDQIDLLISLRNFDSTVDPTVTVSEPGTDDLIGLSPTLTPTSAGEWIGKISFSATSQGMGNIRSVGAVGNSLLRLQSTYRLQRTDNALEQDIFSNDGNLGLHLEAGSLPGNETYLVVMPPGAIPGALPVGLEVVGDTYDITASGAIVTLEKPGILHLHYDPGLVGPTFRPEELGIYRWDPNPNKLEWTLLPSDLDRSQRVLTARITTLGTYALLKPQAETRLYLPAVFKP